MLTRLKRLLNLLIRGFIDLKLVNLIDIGNSIVKLSIKHVNLYVNKKDLDSSFLGKLKHNKMNKTIPMTDFQIFSGLKKLINIYPINKRTNFEIFKNIDLEFNYIEKLLRQRKRKIKIPEPLIKGKIHFRQKLENCLRIFVSKYRINYQSIYEQPMVKKLQKNWSSGKIFPNFCVFEVNFNGTRILFELDALAVMCGELYIFEIKNKNVNDLSLQMNRMEYAAKIINIWQSRMNNPIKCIYPILYFRELNTQSYDNFNIINYQDLLDGNTIDIASMKSYPLTS